MLKIPTKYLLLVNGLLWTAIGTRIALIGIDYYQRLEQIPWWYFLLSAIVFAGFWFMITLGITLKRIPQVPDSFIAWFYCGLGPGLLSAGIRFIVYFLQRLSMGK